MFSKAAPGSYQPVLKDRPSRDSYPFSLNGWSTLESGHSVGTLNEASDEGKAQPAPGG
jgi:hypothetical protein